MDNVVELVDGVSVIKGAYHVYFFLTLSNIRKVSFPELSSVVCVCFKTLNINAWMRENKQVMANTRI